MVDLVLNSLVNCMPEKAEQSIPGVSKLLSTVFLNGYQANNGFYNSEWLQGGIKRRRIFHNT